MNTEIKYDQEEIGQAQGGNYRFPKRSKTNFEIGASIKSYE